MSEKELQYEKESEKPEFDINLKGFNIKAWHLKNTESAKGVAWIEVRYNDEIIRNFTYPSYKIWNLAAHFNDIVDGELSRSEKDRGYKIASSTGF